MYFELAELFVWPVVLFVLSDVVETVVWTNSFFGVFLEIFFAPVITVLFGYFWRGVDFSCLLVCLGQQYIVSVGQTPYCYFKVHCIITCLFD